MRSKCNIIIIGFMVMCLISLTSREALSWEYCGPQGAWYNIAIPDYYNSPAFPIRQAKFYRACVRHDKCYTLPGIEKSTCDTLFSQDLMHECDLAYPNDSYWTTFYPGILVARAECFALKDIYAEAVIRGGGAAFASDQAESKRGVWVFDRGGSLSNRLYKAEFLKNGPHPSFGPVGHDEISEMLIPDGKAITFCFEPAPKYGECHTASSHVTPAATYTLPSIYNNAISYAVVYDQGTCACFHPGDVKQSGACTYTCDGCQWGACKTPYSCPSGQSCCEPGLPGSTCHLCVPSGSQCP